MKGPRDTSPKATHHRTPNRRPVPIYDTGANFAGRYLAIYEAAHRPPRILQSDEQEDENNHADSENASTEEIRANSPTKPAVTPTPNPRSRIPLRKRLTHLFARKSPRSQPPIAIVKPSLPGPPSRPPRPSPVTDATILALQTSTTQRLILPRAPRIPDWRANDNSNEQDKLGRRNSSSSSASSRGGGWRPIPDQEPATTFSVSTAASSCSPSPASRANRPPASITDPQLEIACSARTSPRPTGMREGALAGKEVYAPGSDGGLRIERRGRGRVPGTLYVDGRGFRYYVSDF